MRTAALAASKLRKTGLRNLEIAYPAVSVAERQAILSGVFDSLGNQLAEFAKLRQLTLHEAQRFVRYEGLEHFIAARARGKGVLVVTGHLGAWELSSFFHSLSGFPMTLVIRRLDNPLLDTYVNEIRCLHGNRIIHKDDFARGLLSAMAKGETVGVLMDTNMTPPQGVFVPFFGLAACTAAGVARVAQRTGAAVLPGFLVWSEAESQYVLHFGEEIEIQRSEDTSLDTSENTARATAAIESYVRRFPEQWLWLHRRWKTRPPGEKGVY